VTVATVTDVYDFSDGIRGRDRARAAAGQKGADGKTVTDKLYGSAAAFVIICGGGGGPHDHYRYTRVYYYHYEYYYYRRAEFTLVRTRCRTTPTVRALPPPINWVSIYYVVAAARFESLAAGFLTRSPERRQTYTLRPVRTYVRNIVTTDTSTKTFGFRFAFFLFFNFGNHWMRARILFNFMSIGSIYHQRRRRHHHSASSDKPPPS